MAHSHSHAHGHSCSGHHNHAPADFGRAFIIGITLNTLFIIVEVIWGLRANSLALLADAGHNVSDVISLMIAYGVATLAKRAPTARFTYGMRSASILGSLINAVLLLVVVGAIGWEAVQRMIAPVPAHSGTVMTVAAIGVLINGGTAMLFISGRKNDLNIRGAYLHMAADALVSLGVVVAGGLMWLTGWFWIDPVISLLIMVVIVISTWGLLRESINLALDAVPEGINPVKVKAYLATLPGVRSVHDLHIWAMSTTEVAASVHLVMPDGHPGDAFLFALKHDLMHDYNISHATIQVEIGNGPECPHAPDHVV